ncbi:MAG: hypothetical protein BWK76_05115 [Desulfobulbaceae bacterium A2]|nr:MAG: hypothetical protein BWK76_05115 [Desulfobulbaceae bacterium A2]
MLRILRRKITLILSCCTVIAGCAPRPPAQPPALGGYSEARAQLEDCIRQQMRRHGVVGLSLAVLEDQQVVFSGGFGWADQEAKVPATAQTRYRAGSISKVFTAAAVMQLAEAGRIDIDAPLTTALPDFSVRVGDNDATPITPRLVMTHHAGLPEGILEGFWTDQPQPIESELATLREQYRSFPPGLVHAYSNLGYTLLGVALQQLDGQPYDELMQRRLLQPLGMADSSFAAAPPAGPLAARAYDIKGRPAHEPGLREVPAGGLNTTAPDLVRFARMCFADGNLDGTPVLSPPSVAEMSRPQNADCPLDADLRVGLAWHFVPELAQGAGPVLMHDGGTINHRSILVLLPAHKLAVAVLANSAGAGEAVVEIARQALSLYLAAHSGIVQPRPSAALTLNDRYPPAPSERFSGAYMTEIGFLTIGGSDEKLRVDTGNGTLVMTPREHGYQGLSYHLLGFIPINLGRLGEYRFTRARIAEREVLLAATPGGFMLAGERIEPVPIPASWRNRLGSYRYVGSDAFLAKQLGPVRLLLDQGFLLAEITADQGVQRMALAPVNDERAVVRGLGRSRGESVLAIDSDEAGDTLQYAGLVFRRQHHREGQQ